MYLTTPSVNPAISVIPDESTVDGAQMSEEPPIGYFTWHSTSDDSRLHILTLPIIYYVERVT